VPPGIQLIVKLISPPMQMRRVICIRVKSYLARTWTPRGRDPDQPRRHALSLLPFHAFFLRFLL